MSWFGDVLKGAVNGIVGGLPGIGLGAATSLIGGAIDSHFQGSAMDKQNAWSEKMNLQQQEWQEKMWNMNNEYNTPAAQMQRAIDAGINPNTVAGNGDMGQAVMAQQPVIPNSNSGFGVGSAAANMTNSAQLGLLQAQKDNIEADTQNKLANAGTQEAQKELIGKQVENFKIQNDWLPKEKEAYIGEVHAQTSSLVEKAHLDKVQADQVEYMVDNILPLQKELTLKEIAQVGVAIKELLARANAANASAAASYAQKGLLEKQAENVQQQTEGLKIENKYKDLMLRLSNMKTVGEIQGLKLSNDEAKYYVDQLKTFGFNVSEADMDPIIKAVLLSQLGNANEVSKALNNTEDLGRVLGDHSADDLLNMVLSIMGNVASGYVTGKSIGSGIGPVKGVSTGTRNLQSPPGGWFGSSSTSQFNP